MKFKAVRNEARKCIEIIAKDERDVPFFSIPNDADDVENLIKTLIDAQGSWMGKQSAKVMNGARDNNERKKKLLGVGFTTPLSDEIAKMVAGIHLSSFKKHHSISEAEFYAAARYLCKRGYCVDIEPDGTSLSAAHVSKKDVAKIIDRFSLSGSDITHDKKTLTILMDSKKKESTPHVYTSLDMSIGEYSDTLLKPAFESLSERQKNG